MTPTTLYKALNLPITSPQPTSAGVALQAVCVLAVTQAVDEGPQLAHVMNLPRHNHLLLDNVGLGKVRPLLKDREGEVDRVRIQKEKKRRDRREKEPRLHQINWK